MNNVEVVEGDTTPVPVTGSRNKTFITVWRYVVLISNVAILACTLAFFYLNLDGKWNHVSRRESKGLLQSVTRVPVATPQKGTNGVTSGVRSANTESILWPRLRQAEISCADPDFCLRNETFYISDYGAGEKDLIFLGILDVPVFIVLIMWISVSYAIFALPNYAQETGFM